MPKLRNAETEIEGIVQWIGRKFRNHQPTSELSLSPHTRAGMADQYDTPPHKAKQHEVWMDGNLRNAVLIKDGERYFRVEVREIAEDDYEEPAKLEIGY